MKKPSLPEAIKDYEKIRSDYKKGNTVWLDTVIRDFYKRYKGVPNVGYNLLLLGALYIKEGDYCGGITIFKFLTEQKDDACNSTFLIMCMAEYYFENGDTEKGIECLMNVCTHVTNYEESFEFSGVMNIWNKYKHYVEGKVPPSVSIIKSGKQPLLPGECSMEIDEIFSSSDNGVMMTDLANHLYEMSASGEAMNYLNKWEKTAYYVFELCDEVNSGGFAYYFDLCFQHFEKAYQAFADISAEGMIALMDSVRQKFPRNKIPKSFEALENALDIMENNQIDFEDEDTAFYDREERKVIDCLCKYVLENKKHFR